MLCIQCLPPAARVGRNLWERVGGGTRTRDHHMFRQFDVQKRNTPTARTQKAACVCDVIAIYWHAYWCRQRCCSHFILDETKRWNGEANAPARCRNADDSELMSYPKVNLFVFNLSSVISAWEWRFTLRLTGGNARALQHIIIGWAAFVDLVTQWNVHSYVTKRIPLRITHEREPICFWEPCRGKICFNILEFIHTLHSSMFANVAVHKSFGALYTLYCSGAPWRGTDARASTANISTANI